MGERYCPRCMLLFEIGRDPNKTWSIVLPPHDADCPAVAHMRPAPLPPRKPPLTHG